MPENEHTRRIAIKNLFRENVSAFDLQNTSARQLSIDISDLPSGIYFVQVGSKILKFVKL
ncbi:T9SS C-terminal target domain-containing protein [Bacteroidetes/Chlorobi group bacterium MS-B_bin-24]|nr:MAG: T9SS C-terminal target domain-containing protein [Bacteroidetes/Chlorobi group bacterium MS-B_bin-24]